MFNIKHQSKQPQNVLAEYTEYVEGKIDIGEVPLAFCDWAGLEIDDNSPISNFILTQNDHQPLPSKNVAGALKFDGLECIMNDKDEIVADIRSCNHEGEELKNLLFNRSKKESVKMAKELIRRYNIFPNLLTDIYHKIDSECISETSTVHMDSVRKVLVSLGANEEDLY